ncbi:lipid II:glycine glycyltransferase FemX [Ornithinimicrobium sp. Y1847]|uniref:lipid II:glycine glycyltransferase FemX n=1 Tax=Ornithinimicrobium sp. Y1847 TaxID=3405419 RepID=UPI003B682FA5
MPVLDLTDTSAVDRYDAFVRSHPHRSITQDRQWGVVKNDWGQEAVYLEESGEIVAAMTLLVRRLPGGFTVLYAPRGPLVDWSDKALVLQILAEADPLVKKHRAIMLRIDPEIRFDAELDAWMRDQPGWVVKNVGAQKDQVIQPRYNMVVSLRDEQGALLTEDALMAKYNSTARRMVRNARKKGVEVGHGRSDADLRTFHDVYTFMGRRNEITTRGLPYFHRIRDAFEDRTTVATVRHEGDVLAAAVTVDYYGKLYYLYAGSNDTKRNLYPNHLMNHELMLWGLGREAQSYDLGGVFEIDESDGLYFFKRSLAKTDGVTELIGEVDIVHNTLLYAALAHLLPRVQHGRRTVSAAVSQARKKVPARLSGQAGSRK